MKKISTLHTEWMKDAEYRKEYDTLAMEFASLIEIATSKKLNETDQAYPR